MGQGVQADMDLSDDATKLDHQSIQNFNFERATPGMADLMRRLYQIRVDSTGTDEQKEQEMQERKKMEAMKRLDPFEYKKYLVLEDIKLCKQMVDSRKNSEDKRLAQDIRKKMMEIDKGMNELRELQNHVKKKLVCSVTYMYSLTRIRIRMLMYHVLTPI